MSNQGITEWENTGSNEGIIALIIFFKSLNTKLFK